MSRIAIVGLGAIGTAVAGALEQVGGHDITLCVHGRTTPRSILVEGASAVSLCSRQLLDPAEVAAPADWIVLAVKTHQTGAALAWLRPLFGPETVVVPMQNGVEQVASLATAIPSGAVLPAVVWITSSLSPAGVADVRAGGRVVVARGREGASFAELFAGGPISIEQVDDIAAAAWRKLCTNAAASLMALSCRPASMFAQPGAEQLARSLVDECAAVARAQGIDLGARAADDVIEFLRALPPDAEASILRDRRADGPLEWDALVGVIGRLGSARGVATPVADVVAVLLAAASG